MTSSSSRRQTWTRFVEGSRSSSTEPTPPIHLGSQIGFPSRYRFRAGIIFKAKGSRLGARPKLPLHCKNQSNPAEHWRDGGHDPKRPRSEQVERITRAAGGKGQQQQPLAKPGQRLRAVSLPDLASHPFKSALHITLRNRHHGRSLAKALRYVHYIQCVAFGVTAGLGVVVSGNMPR